jgi:hypothetical protein
MLLNIHPAHRSSLHSIQLLAVAKSTDIRVYGIDSVLKPVIADLKCLAKEVRTCTLLYIVLVLKVFSRLEYSEFVPFLTGNISDT